MRRLGPFVSTSEHTMHPFVDIETISRHEQTSMREPPSSGRQHYSTKAKLVFALCQGMLRSKWGPLLLIYVLGRMLILWLAGSHSSPLTI